MIKHLFLASALVVSAGGMAFAQQPPQPQPVPAGGMSNSAPPPPAVGDMPPPPPPPGRHGPPPAGHHGPPPPPKGFDLRLGHGVGLHVDCAGEPMKACVDGIRPLLHTLDQATMPRDDSGDSYDNDSDDSM